MDWLDETPNGRLDTVLNSTGLMGRLELAFVRIRLVRGAFGMADR
jgi:hypothetical protein